MGEKNVKERPLMGEEEFKNYLAGNRVDVVTDFYEKNILHLNTYEAVGKFKSIRRAIKRGHVSLDGIIYPKRPFKNIKPRRGSINDEKRKIYAQLKHRNRQII